MRNQLTNSDHIQTCTSFVSLLGVGILATATRGWAAANAGSTSASATGREPCAAADGMPRKACQAQCIHLAWGRHTTRCLKNLVNVCGPKHYARVDTTPYKRSIKMDRVRSTSVFSKTVSRLCKDFSVDVAHVFLLVTYKYVITDLFKVAIQRLRMNEKRSN